MRSKKKIDEALSGAPQEFTLQRNRWDGITVAEYVKRFHGVRIHVRHAQRLLHELRYSLKRPVYRYVQATEKGIAYFKHTLREKVKEAQEGVRQEVLFEDETGFSLHPTTGRAWGKIGQRVVVRTKGSHTKRFNLFGWTSLVSGRHGMMKWIQGNTEGFIALLGKIASRFKDSFVHLWVDRAKWHRGDEVRAFIREHRMIKIHYLPAYHPELNCQEALWRILRYEETTNVYFESMEDLEAAVFRKSQRLRPGRVKKLCQFI